MFKSTPFIRSKEKVERISIIYKSDGNETVNKDIFKEFIPVERKKVLNITLLKDGLIKECPPDQDKLDVNPNYFEIIAERNLL